MKIYFMFHSLSLSFCMYSLVQGGKEFLMRAHFGLPSVENDEAEGKPPITVKFEIPYFTVSGIQVCVYIYFLMFYYMCNNKRK